MSQITRKWLKQLREAKNMTHEEVAKQSGIERAYYTMIENGMRTPGVNAAKKIANALKFDWTIFYENNSSETLPKNNKSTGTVG